MKELLHKLYFKILMSSKIFKYWYVSHCSEILFDLERFDVESGEITNKYKERLKRVSGK